MFGTDTFLAFMYLYYTDYECNYAATIEVSRQNIFIALRLSNTIIKIECLIKLTGYPKTR